MMDVIREYYKEHKERSAGTLRQMYFSDSHPRISSWKVAEFHGGIPSTEEILWEDGGKVVFEGITIEKYLLHHSRFLALPLLYIHKSGTSGRPVLLWTGETGKASAEDWPDLVKSLDAGYDIVSVDPRGLGETRMAYKAVSPDDPSLAQLDLDQAYVSPLSSVLADYVYNSLLTGRPYFLQMIEDAEIASRFIQEKVGGKSGMAVTGTNNGYTLASAVAETLPNIKLLSRENGRQIRWSEIVEQKTELWPIQYLLPGGAYVH
jgi:hypothetical protein